jgi:protein TonB
MPFKSPAASRHRSEGATRYALLILIALLATAGGVIIWLLHTADPGAEHAAEAAAVADAGPIHRDGAPASTAELLEHARAAMARQQLLAPAGNNAIEWYLQVLKQEPDNRAAQDALREIFPFAATAAEQTISQGSPAEALRQIDLLTRADPTNYTLTILRAKLQAQEQVAADQQQRREREQAQADAAAQKLAAHAAAATLAAPAAAPTAAATPAPAPAAVVPAAGAGPAPGTPAYRPAPLPEAESTTVVAAPRAAARPASTPAAEATAGAAPVLKRRIEPYYPVDARRARRQGWVDVRFTVEADGSVSRASVIDADPKNVFDRAALSAVERWQFTPGTRNGAPAPSELRQRIEFRL